MNTLSKGEISEEYAGKAENTLLKIKENFKRNATFRISLDKVLNNLIYF